MSWAKKTSNLIVIALVSVGVACGEHVPSAQPRMVSSDDGYLLSFTRVNTVESEAKYHFQLCRQPAEVDEVQPDIEETEGKGPTCFNPFEDVKGEPLVFTALPELDGLRVEGITGRAVRYVTGATVVLVFGAIAFILIPKAARLAFTKMWQLHKTSLTGKADDVIKRMAEIKADKARKKAIKKGKTFDYSKYYDQVLEEKTKAFSIFKSKTALFFSSLFVVEGTIKSWQFTYEGGRDLNNLLTELGWGERELELAAAYPFLTSNEGEFYRVGSVKSLLETLRKHQQLIFSAAYLREFPPKTDGTAKNFLNKNFLMLLF